MKVRWCIWLPGFDQRRTTTEAAKGRDLWRTWQDGEEVEEEVQEEPGELLSFKVHPIGILLILWLVGFSQTLKLVNENWERGENEKETIVLSLSLSHTHTLSRWKRGREIEFSETNGG